jgi:hypothetical protein
LIAVAILVNLSANLRLSETPEVVTGVLAGLVTVFLDVVVGPVFFGMEVPVLGTGFLAAFLLHPLTMNKDANRTIAMTATGFRK